MSDKDLLNENPVLYFRQKREKALQEVPSLIEKGQDLIYPELHEEWEKIVFSNSSSLYYGDDVKSAIKIMSALSLADSMEEAKQIYQAIGGAGIKTVALNIVRDFDKRGPEFWLAVTPGEISAEDLKKLSDIKKRNINIEKGSEEKQTTSHM